MNADLSGRWDLTTFFADFDAPERLAFEADLGRDVDALVQEAAALAPIGEGTDEAWVRLLLRYEDVLGRDSHLGTYVGCAASADAGDERFALAEARLAEVRSRLEKVKVELRRALGGASEAAFATFAARGELDGAGHALARLRHEAKTSMAPALEGLAAELGVDGIQGWSRLYDVLSSKLTFSMRGPDGTTKSMPIAQRRSLMADPDRRVREAAFVGGNAAWEGVADITAAALNHLAGARHTLQARRGVAHFLDEPLHQADLSRRTLDAMMEAVLAGAPLARRGLAAKARAMGLPAIAWFDLEAPFPVENAERVSFAHGVGMIRSSFGRVYPRLAAHFESMLDRRWIESEPRDGKRPGAYCATSDRSGDTRVFMTFQGSLGDVTTLAHEVGHAFHSEALRGERVLGRQFPMTLAETASTFAQSLLADGLLADPTTSAAQRTLLLGETAGDAAAFLLDVPARFLFEKRLYEERRSGELPVRRLSELMVQAQRDTFGDALAPGGEDPYFWASKLHFFIADTMFYNFPYTFGFLLSRGMLALWKREGDAFLPRYEAFLRATGRGPAHVIAKDVVGADLESPDFWAEAIETLRPAIEELERPAT